MSVNTTYEITLLEPMNEVEFAFAELIITDKYKMDVAMTSSGRILLLEGEQDVEEVVSIMAALGFADDVGLIRQIVEYVPDREMIEIDFETNDNGKD